MHMLVFFNLQGYTGTCTPGGKSVPSPNGCAIRKTHCEHKCVNKTYTYMCIIMLHTKFTFNNGVFTGDQVHTDSSCALCRDSTRVMYVKLLIQFLISKATLLLNDSSQTYQTI